MGPWGHPPEQTYDCIRHHSGGGFSHHNIVMAAFSHHIAPRKNNFSGWLYGDKSSGGPENERILPHQRLEPFKPSKISFEKS